MPTLRAARLEPGPGCCLATGATMAR
jgi:hypothetical protein